MGGKYSQLVMVLVFSDEHGSRIIINTSQWFIQIYLFDRFVVWSGKGLRLTERERVEVKTHKMTGMQVPNDRFL